MNNTYRDDGIEDLRKSLKKWLEANDESHVSWACNYLRRHPLNNTRHPLRSHTREDLISYICSAQIDLENKDRIRKMRDGWRVAKLKLTNKLASHNIMLSYNAERELIRLAKNKSAIRKGQGSKSLVIEELIMDERDFEKRINSALKESKKKNKHELINKELSNEIEQLKNENNRLLKIIINRQQENNEDIKIYTINELYKFLLEILTDNSNTVNNNEYFITRISKIIENLPQDIKNEIS